MKGEIAEAFGTLMQEAWSGKYASLGPRELKVKLAKFAPQFSDFQQHDSQEFLSFMLGLSFRY
jgi:ubiquitin carboxyl-terminal hydrolase 4/11/15